MDSLIGAQSVRFFDELIKKFRSFFFQSLISVHVESRGTKKTQFVVLWLSCTFFIPETVDCVIFKQRFG